jgi:hypothetical protein
MRNEIFPNIGIGKIKLGMTLNEVRAFLGDNYKEQKSILYKDTKAVYFDNSGLRVEIQPNGCVDAIEAYQESRPIYNGIDVYMLSYSELKEKLKAKAKELEVTENDITIKDENICFWYDEDNDYKFGSVCVYTDEYDTRKPDLDPIGNRKMTIDDLKKMVGL